MLELFDVNDVANMPCGGIFNAILSPIISLIGGLFGGGGGEESGAPAAPAAPDTSAVDAKARADEERRRRNAAAQNSTNATGGQGVQGQAATQTAPLG